jgi:uncharacterized damage-inducible protein DinB
VTDAAERSDDKAVLKRYLQHAREALLWKLDGLSDYDIRRPMTATGTNLLGVVKHVASVELEYFSGTFGRPHSEQMPWLLDDTATEDLDAVGPDRLIADMWATADEPRELIVDFYRRVWVHSDATIDALPLDAIGHVAWWPPDRNEVTLQHILVHVVTETHRHAGHADILRELIDGAAGLRPGNDNMLSADEAWWQGYRAKLERVAKEAGQS